MVARLFSLKTELFAPVTLRCYVSPKIWSKKYLTPCAAWITALNVGFTTGTSVLVFLIMFAETAISEVVSRCKFYVFLEKHTWSKRFTVWKPPPTNLLHLCVLCSTAGFLFPYWRRWRRFRFTLRWLAYAFLRSFCSYFKRSRCAFRKVVQTYLKNCDGVRQESDSWEHTRMHTWFQRRGA